MPESHKKALPKKSSKPAARRQKRNDPLPEKIQAALAEIENLLRATVDGAEYDTLSKANTLFEATSHHAYMLGEDKRFPRYGNEHEMVVDPIDKFDEIISMRLKEKRAWVKWSQREIAEAVNRFGFNWTRVTVADIEAGNRKVSLEELLVLAVLFNEPISEFLLLIADRPFRLPNGQLLSWHLVREMVAGDIDVGPLKASGAAAIIAGVEPNSADDWRPIANFHKTAADLAEEEEWKRQREALAAQPRPGEDPEDVYGTPEYFKRLEQELAEIDANETPDDDGPR